MREKISNDQTIEYQGLRTREQTLYMLLLFNYVFIGCFGYLFHKLFKIDQYLLTSVIMIVILPILLNTYSVFWHINYQKQVSPKESLDELEKELQNEDAPKTIPVILFGLGILLTKSKNKRLVKLIVPYVICSLFFGTVMTELINQLIFDHNNLDRLIVAEELSFMFLSLSFGLMFMTIFLTITMY
jgi:hypothetical protein